jgi:two-component system chemotaxis sensor kinase CheA
MTDGEAVDILFRPGFSTAQAVTDISGRGVGLDVVRAEIAQLGGTVTIATSGGSGTTVTLSLPLTLIILGALLVRSGGSTYGIPLTAVSETVRVPASAIQTVARRPSLVLRGRVLEVKPLHEALAGTASRLPRVGDLDVVVVRSQASELALAVDDLVGKQEIVIKTVEGIARRVPGLAGATVLPDGGVALVLDVHALVGPAAGAGQLKRSA